MPVLTPSAKQQFTDNAGNLAIGYKLYTYANGTTNPQTTWQDRAGSSANTNPIILDARGEATIYLDESLTYDFVLKTAADVQVWTRSGVETEARQLRTDLVAATAGKGADLLGYTAYGAGAVARTIADKFHGLEVNVLDFMPKAVSELVMAGTNTADLSTYVQAARDYLQANTYYRGGTIKFPRGIYKLNSELAFTAYAAQLVHNIYLVGEGPQSTILDFSGCPVDTDGISFDTGSHFGVSNMSIVSAKRDGILIGRGHTTGGANYCSYYEIKNVRVQSCVGNGLKSVNSFMGSYENIWTRDNTLAGFNLSGFHTALNVKRVEASGNTLAGFNVNGVVYSHFSACGADNNGTQGFALSNLQGVTLTSCGSESNGRDGFYFFTSDASATGLVVQQGQNIRGVVMNGCYGLNNSLTVAGGYATFVGASTANSRNIEVVIKGGIGHPKTASDVALYLQGTSGQITLHCEGVDDAAFIAANIRTGSTEVRNASISGRRCMLQTSGAQSIPNTTDTAVTSWNTTAVANDLGAVVTATTIAMPRGVERVRVRAQVAWNTVVGGTTRRVTILKNGAAFVGQPLSQQAPLGINSAEVSTGVVTVAAGDTFQVNVYQDQGGAVALATGPDNGVWFSVEAIN